MGKSFRLEIHTPDREFFSGEVQSLVIRTPTGELGILYHTLPLVTVLAGGVVRILQNNKWMEAISAEGFVRVAPQRVTILSQLCEWPHEIGPEEDRAPSADGDNRLRKDRSMREYRMAKAQLAVQLAKLKVKGPDR